MPSSQILVIDDEPALRQILRAVLGKAGYQVDEADGVSQGRVRLARGDVDVALCDVNMPDGNGIELVRESRQLGLDTIFVMVTGSSSVATAVEALRAGAYDYLMKPVGKEELLHRLEQIEAMRGLKAENRLLRRAVGAREPTRYHFTSPRMQAVSRLVDKVAPTSSTVLIVGESGTGKGFLAREIHEKSTRGDAPFVAVNCSAIPEQLMESEFFGHTKGAFTGADKARKGLFLEADGGTLFLDEIGELPMPMQTKLLHVIEDKQVRAVGSEKPRQVDVRILVATHRNLPTMIGQGTFREDLYFRLSMFQIAIPPLREREEDIRSLIQYLLKAAAERSDAPPLEIDAEAEQYLLNYQWPGNVRELDNVINRAAILAENSCITLNDLPLALVQEVDLRFGKRMEVSQDGSLRSQVQRLEHDIIRRAIAEADGDRRVAARRLGISLSSLYRKLEEPERGPVEDHQTATSES